MTHSTTLHSLCWSDTCRSESDYVGNHRNQFETAIAYAAIFFFFFFLFFFFFFFFFFSYFIFPEGHSSATRVAALPVGRRLCACAVTTPSLLDHSQHITYIYIPGTTRSFSPPARPNWLVAADRDELGSYIKSRTQSCCWAPSPPSICSDDVFSIWRGSPADRYAKRSILVTTQTAAMICAFIQFWCLGGFALRRSLSSSRR